MSKEKQIEEMAKDLDTIYSADFKGDYESGINDIAEALYNADYRKQSEGEWIEHIEKPSWLEDDVEVFYECSICKTQSPAPTKFCPNCGAKMKGGAE